jgi:hypothetical protein
LPILKKHDLDVIALGSSVEGSKTYEDVDILIHGAYFRFKEALHEAFGNKGWYFADLGSESELCGYAGSRIVTERLRYYDSPKPHHRKCSPFDISFSNQINFDRDLPRVDLIKNSLYRELVQPANMRLGSAYDVLD